MITVEPARWPDDEPVVQELFREYAESLGFDLCFQGFDVELATLAGPLRATFGSAVSGPERAAGGGLRGTPQPRRGSL